ncbi:spore cortex biosynthesis protein YabQ [Clostridium mediterraneense]|uniref:spore cortex biosynthesis protein YabQ n=1 Tax=Clostridium mediterraneense TaxID=1805472 RepID=UPI000832CDDD|nr:spore cortex biosynthesis protein YabQ [Clostridium mediterraneense]
MLLPLGIQFNIVIFSCLAGMLVGILFDGYRLIRGFNVPKILGMIQDILFWILISIVIFIFLLVFNYGFLGAYVYLFMFIGVMVYLAIFSKMVVSVENVVARLVFKFCRVLGKNIRYIFKNIVTK